jgi:predicted dehydrogenase
MRAGVIGLGVGEAHLGGYLAEGVEVAALCDRDPCKLAEVGQRYPRAKRYHRAEDLLNDHDIDLVSIASYDWDHYPQLMLALECQKDVFVEKPLCISEEEASGIAAALERFPERTISSNLILRCSPLFARMRSLIQAGALGHLYHVEGSYLYGRLEKITHGWRGTSSNYSVTLGGGVHLIDLLMWMTDDPIVEVQALGGRKATAATSVRFPDTVTAMIRFASGTTGVVTTNFPCVHPHFHRLSLFGLQGSLVHDSGGARWFTERDKPKFTALDYLYRPPAKHLLVAQFVRAVRGEEPVAVTPASIFAALRVCFAIDTSVATQRPVMVEQRGAEMVTIHPGGVRL